MPFCSQCGASLTSTTARFCGSCGSPVSSGGSPAPVARAAPATAYGVTNTSNARVPVNAANPALYTSGGSGSGIKTYGGGGGSGISSGGSGGYGTCGGSGAGVPVNAAFPERYGGSPSSSPSTSRSGSGISRSGGGSGISGGGSGGYGTRGGGGAGVPVNAAFPERYGGSPASSPSVSRSYGGSGGGSPTVTQKKTWEQVRCPGCGGALEGRSTVVIVHKEWHTECWQRMQG